MTKDSVQLGEICYCTVGINTGYIKNELTDTFQKDNRFHKMLNGKDIGRNYVKWNGEWIMYDAEFVKSKGDRGRSLPPEYIFQKDKILVQRTRRGMKRKLVCYYDNEQYYNLNRLSNIVLKNEEYSLKYIYAILNSSLLDFYFNIYFNEYEVKPLHLSKLPIKKTERQLEFAGKSDIILELYKTFQSKVEKFIARLNDNFSIPKINRKIEAFYDFDFKTFINELKKQKINLTLVQQDEWEEYFNLYKDEINQLQSEINKTDQEIDQMVYELYGLTEEEIKIVEESI
jgi:HPt (histidine-containing phosphotransfer) domain-containing protein